MNADRLVRIAHRGASGKGLAPENTLPAFEKAVQLGADAVEMDVHLTRDGHVVVIHDDTLDRTTDRTGAVSEQTLDEIRAADAGLGFGPQFKGTPIPTLDEALDLLRGKALALVEIKPEGIMEAVVRAVKQVEAREGVVLQSFSAHTVEAIARNDPGLPSGLVIGSAPEEDSRAWAIGLSHQLSELGANLLALKHTAASPEVLRELHVRGFAVWVWTVDERADMERMAAGADGIITNYPDRLNEVLAGKT